MLEASNPEQVKTKKSKPQTRPLQRFWPESLANLQPQFSPAFTTIASIQCDCSTGKSCLSLFCIISREITMILDVCDLFSFWMWKSWYHQVHSSWPDICIYHRSLALGEYISHCNITLKMKADMWDVMRSPFRARHNDRPFNKGGYQVLFPA